MKPEEYRLIMRNLELHYQDFMRDSQDSQLFGPDDRMQVEDDYTKSTQHFDNLLRSMEKGEIYSRNNKLILMIHSFTEVKCVATEQYITVNSPFRNNGC